MVETRSMYILVLLHGGRLLYIMMHDIFANLRHIARMTADLYM